MVIDAKDVGAQAGFWCEVLDYRVRGEADGEIRIGPDGGGPGLLFVPVAETKATKNRLHLDLVADDRDVEVKRLIDLGATPADVGQPGDVSWVVLADPEGNEFCVLER
jgi:hypothetical protein